MSILEPIITMKVEKLDPNVTVKVEKVDTDVTVKLEEVDFDKTSHVPDPVNCLQARISQISARVENINANLSKTAKSLQALQTLENSLTALLEQSPRPGIQIPPYQTDMLMNIICTAADTELSSQDPGHPEMMPLLSSVEDRIKSVGESMADIQACCDAVQRQCEAHEKLCFSAKIRQKLYNNE